MSTGGFADDPVLAGGTEEAGFEQDGPTLFPEFGQPGDPGESESLMAARDEARLAERARIRKLAIEHYAMCDCLGDCAVGVPHRQPFADLLGPEDPS